MRLKIRALIIIFIIIFVQSAYPGIDLKGWSWKAPIIYDNSSYLSDKTTTHTLNEKFAGIEIEPWIFDKSGRNLNDLRIIESDKFFKPHIILWGSSKKEEKTVKYDVNLINAAYQTGKYSSIVLDFGENISKNQIIINTSGENFRRKVKLEGSADSVKWDIVSENLFIFNLKQGNLDINVNILQFPINNFRYIRATVYNMPDDPEKIDIISALAFRKESVNEEYIPTPIVNSSIVTKEKERETIIEIDLGFKNIPITRIQMNIPEPFFYRAYKLQGRNSIKTEWENKSEAGLKKKEYDTPWEDISNGLLYRIIDENKTYESLVIDNLQAGFRYLKVTIYNQDNPELKINHQDTKIYRHKVNLIFEYRKGVNYFLIGGNPSAQPPYYDLEKSVRNITATGIPLLKTGSLEDILVPVEKLPWTERNKFLIWIIMVAAVIILISLMVYNLKEMQNKNTDKK